VAARVVELVYLDAFVPGDGDSIGSLTGLGGGPKAIGGEWLVPPIPRQLDDPVESEWMDARRTPQPARCFAEPVRLRQPLESYPFGRTYIKATDDPPRGDAPSPFWQVAGRVRSDPAWRYHEIDTNHMIPQNRPKELVDLLLPLAPD
jgi:hypothetical protein